MWHCVTLYVIKRCTEWHYMWHCMVLCVTLYVIKCGTLSLNVKLYVTICSSVSLYVALYGTVCGTKSLCVTLYVIKCGTVYQYTWHCMCAYLWRSVCHLNHMSNLPSYHRLSALHRAPAQMVWTALQLWNGIRKIYWICFPALRGSALSSIWFIRYLFTVIRTDID